MCVCEDLSMYFIICFASRCIFFLLLSSLFVYFIFQEYPVRCYVTDDKLHYLIDKPEFRKCVDLYKIFLNESKFIKTDDIVVLDKPTEENDRIFTLCPVFYQNTNISVESKTKFVDNNLTIKLDMNNDNSFFIKSCREGFSSDEWDEIPIYSNSTYFNAVFRGAACKYYSYIERNRIKASISTEPAFVFKSCKCSNDCNLENIPECTYHYYYNSIYMKFLISIPCIILSYLFTENLGMINQLFYIK